MCPGGSLDIGHIGSAHDDAVPEVVKAVARQRLAAVQDELGPGLADLGRWKAMANGHLRTRCRVHATRSCSRRPPTGPGGSGVGVAKAYQR